MARSRCGRSAGASKRHLRGRIGPLWKNGPKLQREQGALTLSWIVQSPALRLRRRPSFGRGIYAFEWKGSLPTEQPAVDREGGPNACWNYRRAQARAGVSYPACASFTLRARLARLCRRSDFQVAPVFKLQAAERPVPENRALSRQDPSKSRLGCSNAGRAKTIRRGLAPVGCAQTGEFEI